MVFSAGLLQMTQMKLSPPISCAYNVGQSSVQGLKFAHLVCVLGGQKIDLVVNIMQRQSLGKALGDIHPEAVMHHAVSEPLQQDSW